MGQQNLISKQCIHTGAFKMIFFHGTLDLKFAAAIY